MPLEIIQRLCDVSITDVTYVLSSYLVVIVSVLFKYVHDYMTYQYEHYYSKPFLQGPYFFIDIDNRLAMTECCNCVHSFV